MGLGPGVVKGAYAQTPRYFADTDRVQDAESRLLTCMETLQGFNAAEIVKTPFGRGKKADVVALVTYLSAESKGMKVKVQPNACQGEGDDGDGPQGFLPAVRPPRLFLRVLPRRRRPADSTARPAQHHHARRRRQGLDDLARLPGEQWPDVVHAVPPERLLSPAALSRSRCTDQT